jgi:hypothetical protein
MTAVHTSGVTDSGRERARVVQLHPSHMNVRKHQSHVLHQGERVWAETNCYVDLWIELLHGYGLDPRAALAFTVTQDFEGDQFTFFKFPLEDLDKLYGLQVQELAIYDSLEDRVRRPSAAIRCWRKSMRFICLTPARRHTGTITRRRLSAWITSIRVRAGSVISTTRVISCWTERTMKACFAGCRNSMAVPSYCFPMWSSASAHERR